MNTLLLSEIQSQEKDLLETLVLLEDYIFKVNSAEQFISSFDPSLDTLETIIEQCQAVIAEIVSPLDKSEVLMNELFYQHLFIDNHKKHWPISAFKVAASLNQRSMSPIVKAVLLCEIINACDFSADIVFVPNKVMVRLCCDEQYAIIFDPVTGESLDWHELDLRLEELEGDPSQHEFSSMNREAILAEHLSALKNALIRDKAFEQALSCVDLLLSLNPDDPLQRRDRGFLLHQLDCFKVAVDDYRYFVEKCPKDPAAQLLKAQLDNITLSETTFH
ncbi:tetratricopeptide repeat protein [Colwellia sp. 4_MG-2023]|jgi:regulator of sirC expression with transglutaminase-like and TPR domain|uniref:tetratricopeptide repeat protein n=1 Tax=unclassified Colwellia TaxID=196834 RepID=UPI001C09B3C1|nr:MULTISPECIES: tetratricopeptide repeat protein [unclassified Colwellia]MBU2926433.1 tetratricopeptide repeat protein [Colwellia sp. C2M11]MDO6488618.1 tetratricopeptide repeat protein [Colwellia sp. 6_MG-2023]MDO6507786.1 tetratricopeptide repeat protein [Colwellia sp. 5_MG-2023]MDO6556511.1 tetratricopeptide repeat protein [Colwellia sp. 4_MG-2023]MDO6654129.1 tetratricopeptide repeat protein [Colwellia sp. 3_MG-2023]